MIARASTAPATRPRIPRIQLQCCVGLFISPLPFLIESFGYVFPAALAHTSAMGARARCEIVSASVTVRQIRFIGCLRRIWYWLQTDPAQLPIREGVRGSRDQGDSPMTSGQ